MPFQAGGILHEIGHYLNLTHTDGQPCLHNVMESGNNSGGQFYIAPRDAFTSCQLREAYAAIMFRNIRNDIQCEAALDHYLTVDSDELWDFDIKLYYNVRVKEGATLTITCKTSLPENGKIIVERGGKLIIDGGVVTANCENEFYRGIIVEGDALGYQANSGIVELKNGAIIEHARDAISMNPSHLPWSSSYNSYFGGIVRAEDAIIRDCKRGVEFM